jgi:hypothetical protein
MLLLEEDISNFTCSKYNFLYVEFSNFYVNQSLTGQTIPTHTINTALVPCMNVRTNAYN